jgi:heme/copper-type cytochrome/quinol oxidase subunit 2
MNNSDLIGTAINIGLVVLLVLTAILGCIRLYRFRKEQREAAREESREKELWE